MAVITATWGAANPIAPQAVFNSWGVLSSLSNTQSGRDSIRSLMQICDLLDSPDDVTNGVFNWLSNAVRGSQKELAKLKPFMYCHLSRCRPDAPGMILRSRLCQ
jgi:hypothetical protein